MVGKRGFASLMGEIDAEEMVEDGLGDISGIQAAPNQNEVSGIDEASFSIDILKKIKGNRNDVSTNMSKLKESSKFSVFFLIYALLIRFFLKSI